jgi:hypothetical protein
MSEILNTDDDLLTISSIMLVSKSDNALLSTGNNFLPVIKVQILINEKDTEREPILVCDSDEAISSDRESEFDESTVVVGDNSNVNGSHESE